MNGQEAIAVLKSVDVQVKSALFGFEPEVSNCVPQAAFWQH